MLRWSKPQLGEYFRLETFGVFKEQRRSIVRPNCSREFSGKFCGKRFQRFYRTAKTTNVSGEREAECYWNRVLTVSSADLHCFRFAERDVDEHSFQLCE